MTLSDGLIIVLCMAVASYLPRVVPAFLMGRIRLNPFVRRFLHLTPYTAMTALIFPSIITCVPEHSGAAIAGTAAALLSAFLKLPLAVTVIIGVLAVYAALAF